MAVILAPLRAGTKLATIGTFYPAEVVSSEVTPRGHRKSVVRWTDSNPAAGIRAGETEVWVQVVGRTPRFVITAQN